MHACTFSERVWDHGLGVPNKPLGDSMNDAAIAPPRRVAGLSRQNAHVNQSDNCRAQLDTPTLGITFAEVAI